MLEEIAGKPVRRPRKDKDDLQTFLKTNDGYPLTRREGLFIENYIKTGNMRQAAEEAGCKGQGGMMLSKDYIRNEINFRIQQDMGNAVAERMEILNYFTRVMRGEVKDQFGLDAPLSERTAAAKELAKRLIDVKEDNDNRTNAGQIQLTLNWARR